MMSKSARTMLVSLSIFVAIFVTSFGIYASSTGTASLARGGSSKEVTTDTCWTQA